MDNIYMSDNVTVNSERLGLLENEVKYTQRDVCEIKTDIRDIKESGKAVELAVIKLAQIAESNQRISPRLDTLEKKVEKNSMRLAMWGGGITVLMFVLSKYGYLLVGTPTP